MKVKDFLTTTKGKVATAFATFGGVLGSAITARAEGASEAVAAAQSLMGNVTSTLNITNIVAILGAGLGAVVGLYLAWWGAKKLVKMVKKALNGKLTIS